MHLRPSAENSAAIQLGGLPMSCNKTTEPSSNGAPSRISLFPTMSGALAERARELARAWEERWQARKERRQAREKWWQARQEAQEQERERVREMRQQVREWLREQEQEREWEREQDLEQRPAWLVLCDIATGSAPVSTGQRAAQPGGSIGGEPITRSVCFVPH